VIEKVLESLPPREKEIIKMYFGIGENEQSTLESIAQRFQLTRERVRQIKAKAIMRLKKNTTLEHLDKSSY
jgi:RNA polymerase primary sigma factor